MWLKYSRSSKMRIFCQMKKRAHNLGKGSQVQISFSISFFVIVGFLKTQQQHPTLRHLLVEKISGLFTSFSKSAFGGNTVFEITLMSSGTKPFEDSIKGSQRSEPLICKSYSSGFSFLQKSFWIQKEFHEKLNIRG